MTKRLDEVTYLATRRAFQLNGGVTIAEVNKETTTHTRIMVLDNGRIAFIGSLSEFEDSALPAVRRLPERVRANLGAAIFGSVGPESTAARESLMISI